MVQEANIPGKAAAEEEAAAPRDNVVGTISQADVVAERKEEMEALATLLDHGYNVRLTPDDGFVVTEEKKK